MDDKARIDEQHSQLCSWLCDAAYPLWSTNGRRSGGRIPRTAGAGRQAARGAASFARHAAPGVLLRDGAVARLARRCRRARQARARLSGRALPAPGRSVPHADQRGWFVADDRALAYDQAFGLLAFNLARRSATARATRERQALELARAGREAHEAVTGGFRERRADQPAAAIQSAHAPVRSHARGLRGVFGELVVETAGATRSPSSRWRISSTATECCTSSSTRTGNSRPASRAASSNPDTSSNGPGCCCGGAGDKHPARARSGAQAHRSQRSALRARRARLQQLLDDFSPHDAGARLWPQTERLKAAALAARLTGEARYFSMAVGRGRWADALPATARSRSLVRPHRRAGKFVDEPAPASSFYHLVAAIAEISALARFS